MTGKQQVKDLPRSQRQVPKVLVAVDKSFRHQNRGIQVGRINPK